MVTFWEQDPPDRIAFFDGTNAMRIGDAWIAISPPPPHGNEAKDFCKAIGVRT